MHSSFPLSLDVFVLVIVVIALNLNNCDLWFFSNFVNTFSITKQNRRCDGRQTVIYARDILNSRSALICLLYIEGSLLICLFIHWTDPFALIIVDIGRTIVKQLH